MTLRFDREITKGMLPPDIIELKTPRLILRAWREADKPVFARINADPAVMKYYPAPLTAEESNDLAAEISHRMDEQGWGFWAVELKTTSKFIGFVGLNNPGYELPVSPCAEIGWRLAKAHWGMGYATEAGHAALDFGFTELQLPSIYSFASVTNTRSVNVMRRLGMNDTRQNFEHPIIPPNHPLREHVLYKINNPTH